MTNILHSNLHIFWLFSCFLQKILIIASICSVQKYNEKKNNRILVIFITTLFLFWILLLFDRKNNFYPFSVPSSSIPFISIQFHSIYAIQFIRNGARFLLHWLQNSEWINLCELLNFDDGKDIIFFFQLECHCLFENQWFEDSKGTSLSLRPNECNRNFMVPFW